MRLFPFCSVFGVILIALLAGPVPSNAQSTWTVTSTADDSDFDTGDGVCDTDDSTGDGPCTLRAAIEQANATDNVDDSTPDRIEFNISGSGPHVIAPESYRPTVSEAVVVDGTTEPDYSGTPVVVLDGAPNDRDFGVVFTGTGSTLRGLSVIGFNNSGINLSGNGGHTVAGCYIGVHPDGTAPGNPGAGLLIGGDSVNNRIGGPDATDRNIIGGNGEEGIEAFGRTFPVEVIDSTVVQNNWIGLTPDGTTAAGNGDDGLALGGPGDGVQVLDNVIASNGSRGVDAANITNAIIQGNRIGTTSDGMAARPNGSFALQCDGCGNLRFGGTGDDEGNLVGAGFVDLISDDEAIGGIVVEGNVIGLDAAGTAEGSTDFGGGLLLRGDFDAPQIGGPSSAARNVIANTTGGAGIDLDSYLGSQPGDSATIENNYIGLDVSGTLDRHVAQDGINILSGNGHHIIDNVVVAGDGTSDIWTGIDVGGNSSTANDGAVVQGNRVGTRADGTGPLGGVGTGLNCSFGENATIGGTGDGEANRIVGSVADGLRIGCTGSTVVGNVIGRDADGTVVGNGRDGIYIPSIPDDTANITLGGTTSGAANVIAGSGRNGITLEKADVTGNIQWPDPVTIRRNRITESEQVGIDLDDSIAEDINNDNLVDGETPNDPNDDDADAPNNLQNFPEVSRFEYDAAANTVTVDFTVDTDPANATYPLTIEWYRTGSFGQAEAYLADATIDEANAQTLQTETFTPQASMARQDFVVATVTTADGRTSELNPLEQTVTVAGSTPDTYAFDYLELRVDAIGPDNGTAPLTVRNELRDPENGPPSGTALAIAGSWTPRSSGSVVLDQLCLPLDNLINDPAQVNESAVTVYSRAAADEAWAARPTELETIDGGNYVCGSGPLGDEYIVAADPSDLPVELVAFDAAPSADGVQLTWTTTAETNNAGFAVERRSDGTAFTEIAFVEGTGTTEQSQAYRFTDDAVPYASRTLTYRLKQVDLDGTATYSSEVTVRPDTPAEPTLAGNVPNPFTRQTTIRYALPRATDVHLAVYDALGRKVATLADGRQRAGRKEIDFQANSLAAGIYFVRLRADDRTITRKITVMR